MKLPGGLFKTTVKKYKDNRSFAFALELAANDHIVLEEDVVVDAFIQTSKLYITLQTFSLDKRTLGGVYRFKVVDAFTMKPVSGIKGTFLFSPTETGEFKSGREGDVYLENLRVGITNIQLLNSEKYFNNIENGVKVTKPETMTKQKQGRTFLQVPLNIRKQMVATLTWIGEDLKLNLVA